MYNIEKQKILCSIIMKGLLSNAWDAYARVLIFGIFFLAVGKIILSDKGESKLKLAWKLWISVVLLEGMLLMLYSLDRDMIHLSVLGFLIVLGAILAIKSAKRHR